MYLFFELRLLRVVAGPSATAERPSGLKVELFAKPPEGPAQDAASPIRMEPEALTSRR
jgi:hypothetical protein